VKGIICITAALASLAVVGQASAANYKVFLGEQTRPPAGVPKNATLDVFLPDSLTIKAGDSVTFSSASFHTATYAPKRVPIIVRDPAKGKYAPLADVKGKNFWFAGLPKFVYNVRALAPMGPHSITPGTPASSGVLSPNGPKAKPATFTFTFPKAGTFKFFCQVHPHMTATVVVKPAGTAVPKSPAQVAAQALADVRAGWEKVKQDAATAPPPAPTVLMGVGDGPNLVGYLPETLRVKVGTTVTWVNKSPAEPHNVAFGPKKYIEGLEKKTDLFPMGPTGPNQVSPLIAYGSEPRGHYQYDGTNNGNGLLVTPVTAAAPGIGPLPRTDKVTFTKPGTYKYFCWIHGPDMHGTVIVTP
jgi:plastocyanin